ncbi:hypothetical protein EV702DRAFT_1050065 [Suillus placidus]|uniref:Uncharacterized protein n=1 Tax=Suillus placidus TaxID=48579 RepID=A0A9P6ZJ53_9AGAM|nr:hypothetical protein EV702DRAFT_1050065 [Suillus placidus]
MGPPISMNDHIPPAHLSTSRIYISLAYLGPPVSIGNNIPPGPSVIIEDIHNMGPWSGGPYNTEFVTEGARSSTNTADHDLTSPYLSASPRATQASHTSFHILQGNLSTVKAHVQKAYGDWQTAVALQKKASEGGLQIAIH